MNEEEAGQLWDVIGEHQDRLTMEVVKEMVGDSTLILAPGWYREDPTNETAFDVVLHHGTRGELARENLREMLLYRFNDDPDHWQNQIAKTAKAMRAFADELDALLKSEFENVR